MRGQAGQLCPSDAGTIWGEGVSQANRVGCGSLVFALTQQVGLTLTHPGEGIRVLTLSTKRVAVVF